MKIRLYFILITPFLLLSAGCRQLFEPTLERRIEKVEQGLLSEQSDPPWKSLPLAERMDHYNVPGVSIAVINDFQIEWAKGYGVLATGTEQNVTPETLFQTGSCAKPVIAAVALHHVEQGLIELDRDVNQYLVSWQIPKNEYTVAEKVTLRRLLNHSAGLTEHGYRGYAQGETLPTFQQIMDGVPPANSPPIRVHTVPGTQYRYSNGGYLTTKLVLEDVTGKPFPEIMQDNMLKPWGMRSSFFESPPPETVWDIAAWGHRADGRSILGKWHTYPEMGTGASMWSTPSDLARFTINLMQAYAGEPNQLLSQEMAVQMLTPGLEGRGLGPYVADDGGDLFYFIHPGANDGFKCYLVAYPKRGQGVVIMTNSDNGDLLYAEIVNSVSVEYGWLEDYSFLYISVVLVIILGTLGTMFLRRKKTNQLQG